MWSVGAPATCGCSGVTSLAGPLRPRNASHASVRERRLLRDVHSHVAGRTVRASCTHAFGVAYVSPRHASAGSAGQWVPRQVYG